MDALGDAVRSDPITCENTARLDPRRDCRRPCSGPTRRHRGGTGRNPMGSRAPAYRWCRAGPAVASRADRRRLSGASAEHGANELDEIDVATRVAVVEAGASTPTSKPQQLSRSLVSAGPVVVRICSIGGNIATNAGGLCCVKYGSRPTTCWARCVLADGTLINLGGKRIKDVAGLSLLKLSR